jgi:hypothetical protein
MANHSNLELVVEVGANEETRGRMRAAGAGG